MSKKRTGVCLLAEKCRGIPLNICWFSRQYIDMHSSLAQIWTFPVLLYPCSSLCEKTGLTVHTLKRRPGTLLTRMVHQFRSTAEVAGWLLFISASFSLSKGPAGPTSGPVTVEGIDVASKRPKDGNLKRKRRYNSFLYKK